MCVCMTLYVCIQTPGGIYYYVDGHPAGYEAREFGESGGEWGLPRKVWQRPAGYTGRDWEGYGGGGGVVETVFNPVSSETMYT
jgi:hypothetical protein